MKRLIGIIGVMLIMAVATLAVVGGGLAANGTTERVSVASDGTQANGESWWSSISADGRFVAFYSYASNLVPGDTNGYADVFVRDRTAGTTERVSVASDGTQANDYSGWPSISADGRFVAFRSSATNLVPGDTNAYHDIFVRDRTSGTTERVSVASDGTQGNGDSYSASISADGRYVAFYSNASNLVPGDTNGYRDIFLRDRTSGTTERVSVASAGTQANGESDGASISPDGRFVAFHSSATNLVSGDTNGARDVFVRDRTSGTTERVSVASAGTQGNGDSYYPSISADGRFVAFRSSATNLVPGDTNGARDVFVRDRTAGTTERVSVASDGTQGNSDSHGASISPDGRFVAFWSSASNLVPGDTNGVVDIFVRDRTSGTTERVSVASDGTQGNGDSYSASISADGRFVAFYSYASNLVPGDTNGTWDVFVRDRGAAVVGAIAGRVDLQGRSDDGGAVIILTGSTYTTTTAADGGFTITGIAPGVYTATASMPGYLSARRTSVVVSEGMTTTLPPVRLLGGDADNDGDIDIYDLTILGANFGRSVPPADGRADINGDGAVNIFDLVLVGANYGQVAPLVW